MLPMEHWAAYLLAGAAIGAGPQPARAGGEARRSERGLESPWVQLWHVGLRRPEPRAGGAAA